VIRHARPLPDYRAGKLSVFVRGGKEKGTLDL